MKVLLTLLYLNVLFAVLNFVCMAAMMFAGNNVLAFINAIVFSLNATMGLVLYTMWRDRYEPCS